MGDDLRVPFAAPLDGPAGFADAVTGLLDRRSRLRQEKAV